MTEGFRARLELREAFAAFCGVDQYRKFVRTVNTTCRSKGRLLSWQEALWERFGASREVPAAFEEILRVFQVCEVHDCELKRDVVPVEYGLFRPSSELLEAMEKIFPLARTRVLGGCMVQSDETAEVDYCEACRSAEEAWTSAHESR